MSHWNYRVVREKNPTPVDAIEGEYNFSVREVFYNDAGEITGITENPVHPWGESVEDIKRSLERMMNALEKEILIEEDVVYGEW